MSWNAFIAETSIGHTQAHAMAGELPSAMLNVAWLQEVPTAISTPESSPVTPFEQVWIPLILVFCMPILGSTCVSPQCEAKSAEALLRICQQHLGPSSRTATKIQEGRIRWNAIEQSHFICELLELVACPVLMLLAAISRTWEQLCSRNAQQQASPQRGRATVPMRIKSILGCPECLNGLLLAEVAVEQLLRSRLLESGILEGQHGCTGH
mmetsp:Transcript_29756/g.69232  ORF Transcript_29756/g.69232 Transcript_29756/m.69232 type:complete len:210 (+) Transcript_29756:808-1437(+)